MMETIRSLLGLRCGGWRSVRDRHLLGSPLCAACGSEKQCEVHHVVPVSVDATRELDESNLITLCHTCHFVFGHLHQWSSHNPDVLRDAENHLLQVRSRPAPAERPGFSLTRWLRGS